MNAYLFFMKTAQLATFILCMVCSCAFADSIPGDMQKAFDNLQDDDLKGNCIEAAQYLYNRREESVDILRNMLPKLDWQGQDIVLKILTETESYEPDEGVVKIMLERLKDPDHVPAIRECHSIWHYDYILYLEGYVARFKDLFQSYIIPNDTQQLWTVTYLLDKKGVLDEMKRYYTPEIMDFLIRSLRDDRLRDNELYASRICILLGMESLPFLEKELKAGDAQSKPIAQAVIDTILGKNDDDYYIYNNWVTGVQLTHESSYLDSIERNGARSISDFYLIKFNQNRTRFLNEKYESRDRF